MQPNATVLRSHGEEQKRIERNRIQQDVAQKKTEENYRICENKTEGKTSCKTERDTEEKRAEYEVNEIKHESEIQMR